MKILHIINYYQENMGYQENWLPYYQKKMGHDVQILTSDKYFPFPNYQENMKSVLGERYKGIGTFIDKGVSIIRSKSFFEIESRTIILFKLKEIIKEFKPDVIHLHGITNLNILNVLYCIRGKKIKLFVDSHTDYQVSNYTSLFNRFYYKLWSLLYKVIDKNINLFLPITNEASIFLEKEFKIKKEKIVTNYLGVMLEKFYLDKEERSRLKLEYQLEGKIVIVNAGKQYAGKKIDFIINVTRELIKKHKRDDVTLLLIGNATGDYQKFIDGEIQEISDSVIRLPFVENQHLKSYYSLADIGIWPGIPSNTIQEAMACEICLVLPQNGTVNHLINKNGFFIENDDPKDMARKLNKLIECGNLEKYKKESLAIAKKYSWEKIAEDCLELYKKF